MSLDLKTIVADNGSFNLRLGFSNEASPRVVIPNQTAIIRGDGRELVGDETEASGLSHHELLEYRRPHQRGCLLDSSCEEKVWIRALSKLGDYQEHKQLLVTEHLFPPSPCKKISDELFFEKLKFEQVVRVPPSTCITTHRISTISNDSFSNSLCKIIIDCGYSATWVVPLISINPIFPSTTVQRIDIGGKLLTNLLKEEISYHHVNVMDDTHLVENCKKNICYVPTNFRLEKPKVIEYLLPDHAIDLEGRVLKENEEISEKSKRQILRLTQERINVPEVLFDPSRIYLEQAGIVESIINCVSELPFELQKQALNNVLITGGTSTIPGLVSRLNAELSNFGQTTPVIDWSHEYLLSAWKGASILANSENFSKCVIKTKKQYEEDGSSRSKKKKLGSVEQPHFWTL